MGVVHSLFTNIQTLQCLEWTDGQSYFQQVHTRVDFYEANNWTKVRKEDDDENSGSSSSDDEDGKEKKVWGWIPKQGWGYWTKDQVKNAPLEPEFDARY